MKIAIYIAIFVLLFLSSCTNEPSLQKYFVESAEKKNFIEIDISPSIINIDKLSKNWDNLIAISISYVSVYI